MQIDGRKINENIGQELLKIITNNNQNLNKPKLGILCVGEDPASNSFINVKKKFGEKYGFEVNIYKLTEEVNKKEIINKLFEIQKENISVILQLPLPEKFKEFTLEIVNTIDINKDVDNLTGKSIFISPIVLSLLEIINLFNHPGLRPPASLSVFPDLLQKEGKKPLFAIVGMGNVVGKPIKKYFDENKINYEIITEDKISWEKIKDCDVVISGIGKPWQIKKEFIKDNAILIDYGCSYLDGKLCGDFDPECFAISKFYTPVPGGMGPIGVACLFKNVLKSISTFSMRTSV